MNTKLLSIVMAVVVAASVGSAYAMTNGFTFSNPSTTATSWCSSNEWVNLDNDTFTQSNETWRLGLGGSNWYAIKLTPVNCQQLNLQPNHQH